MRRRQIAGFAPFIAYDVHAYTRTALIAAEVIVDGYRLLRRSPHTHLDTIDIAEGQIPARWAKGTEDLWEVLPLFRKYAVTHGATPEAIRLLKGMIPVSSKEEETMAEKLKAKGGKATANKEELKAAAKAAPVAKANDAPAKKPRGNADALKKAREAKGPDERKIKVLNKKHAARAGTFRGDMLDDLLASKTVAEFRAKNPKYDLSCLKHAVDAGYVSVA